MISGWKFSSQDLAASSSSISDEEIEMNTRQTDIEDGIIPVLGSNEYVVCKNNTLQPVEVGEYETTVGFEVSGEKQTVGFEVSGRKHIQDAPRVTSPISSLYDRKIVHKRLPRVSRSEERIYSFKQLSEHLADVDDHKNILQTKEEEERKAYAILLESAKKPVPKMKINGNGDIELRTCTDVKLFDNYIIVLSDENIYKFDKRTNSIIDTLKLPFAGPMCFIRNSDCLGIIQINKGVSVVSTRGPLKLIYRIEATKPYSYICHLRTHTGSNAAGLPNPNFEFGTVYSETSSAMGTHHADKMHIIKAEFERSKRDKEKDIPTYNPIEEMIRLSDFDISGVSSVSAFTGSNKIVICGFNRVTCLVILQNNLKWEWEILVNSAATDVSCSHSFAYICIQDEERIMLVNEKGEIEKENILQGEFEGKPNKLSVYDGTILVKAFDMTEWKSVVFKR